MKATEHNAKTPAAEAGPFATLRGQLGGRGSGVPLPRFGSGTGVPSARLTLFGIACVCAALAFLALSAAPASAALIYPNLGQISGPVPGEHFGELLPESVAVDDHNGHIYVADSGAGLVYDFASAADTSPTVWNGAATPAGSFGGGRVAVAADNSSGDVYVADATHAVIDKFDQDGNLIESFGDTTPTPNGQLAGAVTPAGSFSPASNSESSFGIAVDQATHDLYAIDAGHEVVDQFDSEGNYLGQITEAPGELYGGFTSTGQYTDGIAINDKSEEVLVSDSWDLKAYRFSLAGSFIPPAIDGSTTPAGSFGTRYTWVAADNASGDFYVTDLTHEVVDQFDSEGNYLGQIKDTPSGSSGGIAVGQASDDIYVSESSPDASVIAIYGAGVVIPDVTTEGATEVQRNAATLNGTVNPGGVELKEGLEGCRFEWGRTEAPYEHTAPCDKSAAQIGSGKEPVSLHADITGLTAGTTYHVRLLAANANGSNEGEDETFETLPPPSIDAASAKNVTETSADLTAQVNPKGSETTCSFEYGTDTSYGTSVPCEPANLGSGTSDVPVSRHIAGLSENTTYHWRVLATNTNGTTTGTDHTFVYLIPEPQSCPANEALRTGPSAALSDCRAYEMVTPPQKNAALIGHVVLGNNSDVSRDGSRVILTSIQCFAGAASCSADRQTEGVPFSFTHTPGGWLTTPLAPPPPPSTASSSWLVGAETGAALFSIPTAPMGEDDWYVRRADDGSLRDIGPTTPPAAGAQGINSFGSASQFATSDFSHLVWNSNPVWPFDSTYSEGIHNSVYEYVGSGNSHPFLVGVSGGAGSTDLISTCGTTVGLANGYLLGTLSADGRTVYFTAEGHDSGEVQCPPSATAPPVNELYARIDGEREDAETIPISQRSPTECSGECLGSPPADAFFQGASVDGSKAFFTSTQQLTDKANEDSNPGDTAKGNRCAETTHASGCNLYLYDFANQAGHNLIAASAGDTSGKGPQVQGVMAISPDGSHVYFVAKGVLTEAPNAQGQSAAAGADNLYVYERDASHPQSHVAFLAALPAADESWQHPGVQPANVTPDGRFLVFTSHAALTPDATRPDGPAQVYRYDAQSEELLRISIGERGFNDNGNAGAGVAGIVGGIQGFTHAGPGRPNPTMSDDGARIFFTSPVGLTPQALDDVPIGGGKQYANNVYEWEQAGVGSCPAGQSTGCVSLISDGRDTATITDTSAVQLLGASADGADVFFTATDQLVPQDTDTQLDFYDARIGGGFAASSNIEPCQGDACKGHGTQESQSQSPGSGSFNGPEEGPRHPHRINCKKGFVHKRGACVKQHSKKHHSKHHKSKKRHSSAHTNHGGNR